MDSDEEEEHMREIYLDFGDLSRTVKFLELPSVETPPTTNADLPIVNKNLSKEPTLTSSSKLEKKLELGTILEDEIENDTDSISSSDTDIDIEVFSWFKSSL